MNSILKKTIIKSKNVCGHIRDEFSRYIGNFLIFLATLLFLLVFCTNIFHRIPILAYLIREFNFPIVLNVNGEIDIYIDEQLITDLPVTVKIGGYGQSVYSGQKYNFNFSVVDTQNIPVVIEYQIDNNEEQQIIYISYVSGDYEYTLNKNYKYSR